MVKDSNWTLPNVLTVSRILLTPGFVAAFLGERFDMAWFLFAVAGMTDALDGFLARMLHQRSRLGAMLDPVADKVLLVTAYVCLSIKGWTPSWLTVLVVSRDMLIVGGLFAIQFSGVDVRRKIKPVAVSKLTTLLQIALVLFVMTDKSVPQDLSSFQCWLEYATALFTLVSGIYYVYVGVGLFPENNNGNSGPEAR